MKLLFNVLTAVAAVFPAIAAENGDTVFVDFGELDQSPPVFYNRQRTMPAIMSPQVNTSMAVGEIPFSESVTPSGGKICNVPVAVSEESRLRPEVSLLYNSQGAEGAAGYGWSISGVSAISVVNKTLHYDGVASSPDLSDPGGCAFALDGVRLLEREDAADGFAFETAEGFVRARKVKSGGALTRFDVRYPDGRAAVFGFSDSYETSHIYPVTEITDPDGSKMFYDYIESGNTYYVSHIYYGGKDRAGCYGHVSFEYSDVSGFPASYVAGVEIKPGKILKKIVSSVKVNGAETELMHYDLAHGGDCWHLLTKISAGCGTETLNPLSFDYGYSGMDEGVLQLFSDKSLCDEDAFAQDRDIVYARGKFLKGKYNDGMLMYPEFEPYTENGVSDYSSMSADQSILVCTGLSVNDCRTLEIKAENGLRMLSVLDMDADGADEIVKINTEQGVSESSTRVIVSVYKVVDNGLTTRTEAFEVGVPYHYQLSFLLGNYGGSRKIDLLTVYNDDNNGIVDYADISNYPNFSNRNLSKGVKFGDTSFFTTADFNGDGRDELCEISSSCATVYSVAEDGGQKTLFSDYSVRYDDLGRDNNVLAGVYTVDVNRDGLTDLLYPPTRSRIDERGQVTVQRWVPEACPMCGKRNPILNDYTKTCRQCGGDIYQYYYKYGGAMCPDCGKEMQGDYFPDIDGYVCPTHGRGKITKWITLDDIINGTEWTALLSTGKGFKAEKHDLGAWNKEKFSIMDVDNDGYADIVSSLDGDIGVMLNRSGRFEESSISLDAKGEVMPMNVNGAGSSHFVVIDEGVAHCYEYTADKSRYGLVTSMASSLGVVSANDYGKMTGEGCHGYAEAGTGEMALLAPVNLLARSFKLADGEKVANVSYKYTGSKFNLHGLGFRGFQKITETDSVAGMATVSEYSDIDKIVETDNDMSRAVYTYIKIGSGKFENKRVGSMTVTDKLTAAVTSRSYSYDGYGNALAEKVSYGTDLQTETTFTYQNNATASRYHVGLPLTKTVKRTRGGDQWTDKETYTYDAAGRPLTRVLHTGTSGTVKKEETRWTYDSWGNVLSEMSSPYGSGVFTGTTYAYDSSGRYLTEATGALGLTTSYSGFDKYGNPQSEEDFRGNVTSYSYDTFGRLASKSLPTGAVQTVAFSWGGDGLYKVAVTEPGKPGKETEYDALGREVRSRTMRFDGQWQSVSRSYNAKGQLSGVSLPYSGASPEHWSVYSYDRFGRQTEAVEPSGSVTEWSYSGLTVTETSRGIAKTTRKDASGAVREVTDPGGTILYSYRPDGQPWLMTAPDEIYTEITYDEAGRRKSIADPSAGLRTTSYAYSGGELTVTETDADGRAVATTYDKYGRKAKVVRPEFSTTYGYDGYGQLAMVMSDNGTSRSYIHDTFGRVLTETESVPGGRSLTKAYYYGDDGVPTGVLYAGGRVYHELLYGYSHGTLTEITLSGGGGTVWKLTEMNGMGMPTKVVTGGMEREYGYIDYGMPLYRKFGVHQHFAYDFDPHTGNLMSRTDASRDITEEYGYDNLNRLTDENGRETEYADNGSMVSRDGVGTATYNAAPNAYRLKELRLPDDSDFYYQVSDISYTSFGRPDKIEYDRRNVIMDESGESRPAERSLPRPPTATFTYNERGERVKMEVKGNNGRTIACRYYIGGVYEADDITGEERLYIGGDAYTAPAVDICDADGEWELHFIGRDYLGSITHIADSEGNLVAEYSYDAWGRLRDPDTQELYGNSGVPDLLLWRGFTGHEWLPWFGLYNMNARLYDPVLGRFLSPDPYVQMPDNTQNLNRYLYALNNPFSYTDPSGEFWHLIIGAIIGGFINWALNGFHFNAEGLAHFGIGMAAGALSAGVGAGISSAIAGGTFGAGFVGSSAALTAGHSFINGALIGGGSGLTNGFVSGFGTGLLNGYGVGGAFKNAALQGTLGMGAGALVGGIYSGTKAALDHRRFWDGARVTKNIFAQSERKVVYWRQSSMYSCQEDCAASINSSRNISLTEDQKALLSKLNQKNEYRIGDFWKNYSEITGVDAEVLNSTMAWNTKLGAVTDALNLGYSVAGVIPGGYDMGHMVVINNVYMKTVEKLNGDIVQSLFYNVMNPASGFVDIPVKLLTGNIIVVF